MNLSALPDPDAIRTPRTTSTKPSESVWTSLSKQQRMAVQKLIMRAEEIALSIKGAKR